MSRHRRAAWGGGGGGWPFMVYGQQPGGWCEQTAGYGYGQRPGGRHNDLSFPWANNSSGNSSGRGHDQSLSLDSLANLFTRLILQNHLTRLAGDTLDLGGRGLWGCSVPAAHQNTCSSPVSSCQGQGHHARPHGAQGQSSGCGGINMCGTNNINLCCHTCPAATRAYMGANNVFVIPASHMQQQQQQPSVGFGNLGNWNVDHNGLNMLLNGLGLAMNSGNLCGGAPMGLAGGFPMNLAGVGGGIGGMPMNSGPNFSCRGCNFQM